jgi:hypothetical protein
MRALVLIAVASVTTQLPASDIAPAANRHARGGECAYHVADDAVPISDERTFRAFTVSRSVI